MQRVTGIGGIFFKSRDPNALKAWYGRHLGIKMDNYGTLFRWRHRDEPEKCGHTVWSVFPEDSTYFDPTTAEYMINYRVADLKALLEQLKAEGVWVDDKIEESEFGKFGWIQDPDGVRIELWEPPAREEEHLQEPQ
jgi:predicted enzyme related to lactoylglutathione lyase